MCVGGWGGEGKGESSSMECRDMLLVFVLFEFGSDKSKPTERKHVNNFSFFLVLDGENPCKAGGVNRFAWANALKTRSKSDQVERNRRNLLANTQSCCASPIQRPMNMYAKQNC